METLCPGLQVFYRGLPNHPGHEIAARQMDGFSSLMAFDVEDGYDGGKRMMEGVKVATLAVSLGSIDTLIQHPASMTHACMSPDERLAGGITDGLVRLSVGVEDYDDLLWGNEQGLERTGISFSSVNISPLLHHFLPAGSR